MNTRIIDGPLTAGQIEAFRANGYVVAPDLYAADEMAEIAAWVDEIQNWPETPGQHMMYFETGQDLAGVGFRSIGAEPGDAVFFDSFIPHKSAPNRSSATRRVLYYTYNKASAGDHLLQYYADKRASYPPDIEREAGRHYEYRV